MRREIIDALLKEMTGQHNSLIKQELKAKEKVENYSYVELSSAEGWATTFFGQMKSDFAEKQFASKQEIIDFFETSGRIWDGIWSVEKNKVKNFFQPNYHKFITETLKSMAIAAYEKDLQITKDNLPPPVPEVVSTSSKPVTEDIQPEAKVEVVPRAAEKQIVSEPLSDDDKRNALIWITGAVKNLNNNSPESDFNKVENAIAELKPRIEKNNVTLANAERNLAYARENRAEFLAKVVKSAEFSDLKTFAKVALGGVAVVVAAVIAIKTSIIWIPALIMATVVGFALQPKGSSASSKLAAGETRADVRRETPVDEQRRARHANENVLVNTKSNTTSILSSLGAKFASMFGGAKVAPAPHLQTAPTGQKVESPLSSRKVELDVLSGDKETDGEGEKRAHVHQHRH